MSVATNATGYERFKKAWKILKSHWKSLSRLYFHIHKCSKAAVLREGLSYSCLSKNSVGPDMEYGTAALLQAAESKILTPTSIQTSATWNSGTEELSKKQ